MTAAGFGEAITSPGPPRRRAISRASSIAVPRSCPLAGSRITWAGLVARYAARSVPFGTRADWASAAVGRTARANSAKGLCLMLLSVAAAQSDRLGGTALIGALTRRRALSL